jgi:aspartate/methionine/tyrosine aminotransferase
VGGWPARERAEDENIQRKAEAIAMKLKIESEHSTARIDLRTGRSYAELIAIQARYSAAVGRHLGIEGRDVIPTTGATGAIELVRNHVFKIKQKKNPTLMTVCPEYWRARESFEGLGFTVIEVRTEPNGFAIDERTLIERASADTTDVLYLSLPNNPTGAIFDPAAILAGIPEGTAFVLDMTLPSRDLDQRSLSGKLYREFRGKQNVFLIGSMSKSHETAEHRIGWLACSSSEDAVELNKENRNAVSSLSIKEGMRLLGEPSPVLDRIDDSYRMLAEAEAENIFRIIRPARVTKTGYVLIEINVPPEALKRVLEENDIAVMWGSYLGLTDRHIRLEMLEPENIKVFIDTAASSPTEARAAG